MLKLPCRLTTCRTFQESLRGLAIQQAPPKSCNVKIKEPAVLLNNGLKIPNLGIGTWLLQDCLVIRAVKDAVKIGYRMIDTAYVYANEQCIGIAIKELLEEGIIKSRQDLFITSKLWNTYHSPAIVEKAIRLSLKNLQMDYLDLYLMHWPTGYEEGGDLFPRNACGKINFTNIDYVDTWKAMEQLVTKGLTKSIGIANFNASQIDRILDNANIPPAVLQAECHPYLTQKKLIDYCRSKNIAFTAYSPLGSSMDRPYAVEGEPRLLASPDIERIAYPYNKSLAQVLIRYQIQRDNIVIPRSSLKNQLKENFQVYDWELTDRHMKDLDDMNKNLRYVIKLEEFGQHPFFPFCDDF